MNQKRKKQVINELIKVLAINNITFEEVPELLKSMQLELSDICQQQVIQNP
ncbi:hypothetical protein [Peribacillus loiseleuriae]|uniref:hypothetical protein n=1 Tax=Peribacillus loiseleuriae TaxID=1679170 RepID=UPI000A88567B|nr:hypothetical protein [Peribacillus loiseleuriae]